MTHADKLSLLKSRIGGVREEKNFEWSFGTPEDEIRGVAQPGRAAVRALAEAEYALQLSAQHGGEFDALVGEALDSLLCAAQKTGGLSSEDCRKMEEMLAPMAEACKSYQLILTGHAHIDMNWMWSYQETVAATLATFRTMCSLLEEYPDFTFTQSQASVYRIVEEYDPALMEQIKKYIASGRWEVAATSWVEPDKNMPEGESLLRHIELTRKYLKEVWQVKDFDLDFVPDTFGHAVTVPEIDTFGGVRYLYHCRGNARKQLLYKYRAPSGKEVLVLREANWYNAGITPHMASGLMEVVRRSSGLKAGMVVYGVGDHGGGPTRRDIERALDMRTWPIYPTIRFGGLRDYFRLAEEKRDELPVVEEEMNFFAPGCYTTQSRIKRANRKAENALYSAEALGAVADRFAGFAFPFAQMENAWRDVLFTHFHDILTGSCVRDSREYAMGLFQKATAVTNTVLENSMRMLTERVDTASLPALRILEVFEDPAVLYNSQSEGGGAGYGIENFSGVPQPERGKGSVRVFHLFNTQQQDYDGLTEITVWDYTEDLRNLRVLDAEGNDLPFQLLDTQTQHYWSHRYFRFLVRARIPALGYTTVILGKAEQAEYPVYLVAEGQVAPLYTDELLENEFLKVKLDKQTGRIVSMTDKLSGAEMIRPNQSAGFSLQQLEKKSSDAWRIGRKVSEWEICECVQMTVMENGTLRKAVQAVYEIKGCCEKPSTVQVTYALAAGERALSLDVKADWQEIAGKTVPLLSFKVPVREGTHACRYIIPGGTLRREELGTDVPGISGAAAETQNGKALALISDCKYGYHFEENTLDLSLIHSADYPDPYPERGEHIMRLFLAVSDGSAGDLLSLTDGCCRPAFFTSGQIHAGKLPATAGLLKALPSSVRLTQVLPCEGGVQLRGYETEGKETVLPLHFTVPVRQAFLCTLEENSPKQPLSVRNDTVEVPLSPFAFWQTEVYFS